MRETSDRTTVAVAICTYRRNDDLAVLLQALLACAHRIEDRAAVGVIIIDDTAAGQARGVVEKFAGRFELGLHYDVSGQQNISLARNLAIGTAITLAEWTAMIDDDCEPPEIWLEALLDGQARYAADCLTSRMVRRPPIGSPKWLTDEPFLALGVERPKDGSEVPSGATFNSMIRSRWLVDHPAIRFDPAFGKIGGEDMVFYRAASAEGLVIRYIDGAFVFENEPAARATLSYQLFIYYWHGNSAFLSGVQSGIPRWRMVVHGLASLVRALIRPLGRLVRGRSPQLRYGLAKVLHAVGQLVGSLGVRVTHH